MKIEQFPKLEIETYQVICIPDESRIVMAAPIGDKWHDLYLANHNVFRLDPFGQVMWQVRREENGFVNWEACHQIAKERDPDCEGCMDPFANMGTQFFVRRPTGDPRPFHPKFVYDVFDSYAPGRLLGLSTYKLEYDLDPETGVASCTGMQVK